MATHLALTVVAALLSGGVAVAAQQDAAAKKLFVRVLNSQGFSTRIIYLSKNTTATVAGDPVANGASFHIGFPDSGAMECLPLPSSRWEASPGGFRYRDPSNVFGAVRRAAIRRSQTGRFRVKLVTSHAGIFPPNAATAYFTNFKINNGDEYCSSNGSAVPTKNDHTTFLVRNDDGTACQAACSSPSGAFVDAAVAF